MLASGRACGARFPASEGAELSRVRFDLVLSAEPAEP